MPHSPAWRATKERGEKAHSRRTAPLAVCRSSGLPESRSDKFGVFRASAKTRIHISCFHARERRADVRRSTRPAFVLTASLSINPLTAAVGLLELEFIGRAASMISSCPSRRLGPSRASAGRYPGAAAVSRPRACVVIREDHGDFPQQSSHETSPAVERSPRWRTTIHLTTCSPPLCTPLGVITVRRVKPRTAPVRWHWSTTTTSS
jgi:hypothetical protein